MSVICKAPYSFMRMLAAAAAKSLQSCLTLHDPIDGNPPGSPVPGILQARTLEWVAISFSNAWKWSHSVMSDSSRPHGLQPTRFLCPWDFPGKSTGVGCHCLLRVEDESLPSRGLPSCFLSVDDWLQGDRSVVSSITQWPLHSHLPSAQVFVSVLSLSPTLWPCALVFPNQHIPLLFVPHCGRSSSTDCRHSVLDTIWYLFPGFTYCGYS